MDEKDFEEQLRREGFVRTYVGRTAPALRIPTTSMRLEQRTLFSMPR